MKAFGAPEKQAFAAASARRRPEPQPGRRAWDTGAGNQAVQRLLLSHRIQAKLSVNEPGDPYEQEADQVADTVVRMPQKSVSPPRIQRLCAGCEKEEEEKAQREDTAGVTPAVSHDLEADVAAARAGGQPLPAQVRSFFEPRFGQDFSGVRVHTGAAAEQSAQRLGATAYTLGRDIVFGPGRFAPDSSEGRRLLAHELTHVVQQDAGGGRHVQRDLTFGSGYKNPFGSNSAAEIKASQRDASGQSQWFPSSEDFEKTASKSGGGTGVAKLKDLLTEIGKKPAGSITSLGLIGHGTSSVFALGGEIVLPPKADVLFNQSDAIINSASLAALSSTISGVQDRFAKGASMTVYACDSGVDTSLLDDLSNAFKVCVKGFKDEILWCLLTSGNTITQRGKVMYDTAGLVKTGLLGCASFNDDITKLTPDNQSCKGVSGAAPAPAGPKTQAQTPEGGTEET